MNRLRLICAILFWITCIVSIPTFVLLGLALFISLLNPSAEAWGLFMLLTPLLDFVELTAWPVISGIVAAGYFLGCKRSVFASVALLLSLSEIGCFYYWELFLIGWAMWLFVTLFVFGAMMYSKMAKGVPRAGFPIDS